MMNERGRALKEALRHEIRTILDEDDMTCDTLGRIGRVVDYGQEIVKAITAPVGAATSSPIDFKRSLETSQVQFACNVNDALQGATPAAATPLLPEQTPGETVAVRLLKEIIAQLRPPAAPPALPAAGDGATS